MEKILAGLSCTEKFIEALLMYECQTCLSSDICVQRQRQGTTKFLLLLNRYISYQLLRYRGLEQLAALD